MANKDIVEQKLRKSFFSTLLSDDSKITWYNLPQIFEMFWILEEGVMRASRLMRGFKTAKKMRHYHDIENITKAYQVIFLSSLISLVEDKSLSLLQERNKRN